MEEKWFIHSKRFFQTVEYFTIFQVLTELKFVVPFKNESASTFNDHLQTSSWCKVLNFITDGQISLEIKLPVCSLGSVSLSVP